MKVTAVVVTYNRCTLLKECIEALLKQTYTDMDILLVDNNSTDGTREYLQQIEAEHRKKIKVLYLQENIGGAGGFHEGIKGAMKNNPDWLWLMDDDTIPESEACEELCKAIDVIDEKIGFLASNVYGMHHECMNTPRMKLFQKGKNGYADWNIHLADSLVKVNSATFCACFISADAVKTVGLPIKEYFIWGDDTEYTLRLSRYYGQGWLVGKSLVLHKRLNGQALSIKEEDNPNRIPIYYYYVRNYLINLKLYYFGYCGASAKTLHFMFILMKILLGKSKFKWKKIKVIIKGIFAFWFCQYNVRTIKNRLKFE